MKWDGGVAVVLVITDHLDDEQPFGHLPVVRHEFLIAAKTQDFGAVISVRENFLVTNVRLEEVVADGAPLVAAGDAEPTELEHTVERPDDLETAGPEEIGVVTRCS
jgi:hypothetical protein